MNNIKRMLITDVSTLFGFWPERQVDISLERLLKMMDRHEHRNMSGRFEGVQVHRIYDEELKCFVEQVTCPTAGLAIAVAPIDRGGELGSVCVIDKHSDQAIVVPTEIAIEVAFAIIRQANILTVNQLKKISERMIDGK